MKLPTAITGLILILAIYLVFPIIFIRINEYFALPVINFTVVKPLGLLFIIGGLSFLVYLIFLFDRQGKGTPVPTQPTKKLIISGPYKYTRNPMYLTHMVVLSGIFIFSGYLLLLLDIFLTWLVLQLFLVCFEEPNLKKKFGKEYREYLQKIPRWLRI